ncbi:cell surface protein [Lactobacillus sp. CBA3606]|uniref:DUF916 and DUF3324 domain-containing protein n=1 Tax=Lactobacillus sp. CBA3606 TaxID=2099789 RepID=UPI000CFB2591|nr:DUF916 and DUF3324 domain-containing protein [Lactobacillus sp. CBA3606]AVK63796.1 cell surface protein [Lactobacillus sp. CBA3606]
MVLTKRFYKISLAVIVFLMGVLTVTKISANTVGFEVAPVTSSEQADKSLSYFDLQLAPKKTTTLAVKVKNTSDKAITVHTAVAKATTNLNAAVEYKRIIADKSIDLPADFEKLVTTEMTQVKLKKGETKVVTFKVKMPAKTYDGVVVGGLTFLKKTEKAQTKSAMAIKNQYSYTIAVVLHGKKDLTKNRLTLGAIKGSQSNGYNQITLALENHTAAFLNQLKTNVKIYQRGGSKVVYKQTNEHGQMAPSSIYELPLKVGKTALKPGKYTAKVKVTSKKQHWQFDRNFTITSDQAKKLNKTAVIEHKTNWVLWIAIGLLILILLLLIGWYIYRKQRKIKELERQLKEQNKSE